jgi:hypothetical protein
MGSGLVENAYINNHVDPLSLLLCVNQCISVIIVLVREQLLSSIEMLMIGITDFLTKSVSKA